MQNYIHETSSSQVKCQFVEQKRENIRTDNGFSYEFNIYGKYFMKV